jgi:hypothetical protein
MLRIPEPIEPFQFQSSVVEEVNSLLLAPRYALAFKICACNQVPARFSGNRLGIWTLSRDFAPGDDSIGNRNRLSRRSGADANRPASSDTSTPDNEGALEAEKAKESSQNHDYQMNILEDAFKNRFT